MGVNKTVLVSCQLLTSPLSMNKARLLALFVLIFLVLRVFADTDGPGSDVGVLRLVQGRGSGVEDRSDRVVQVLVMNTRDRVMGGSVTDMVNGQIRDMMNGTDNTASQGLVLSRVKRFPLAGYLAFLFLVVNTGKIGYH